VVQCLVHDKGWYRSAVELYSLGFVYLEKDDLINSQVGYNDYEVLAPYGWEEEMDDDGDYHVVFKID